MTFPAFEQFGKEIGHNIRRGYARWRVYMHLQSTLDFGDARPVKVWAVAEATRMKRESVIKALRWLTDAGYVIEQGRSGRGVRLLRLAWSLQPRSGVSSGVSLALGPHTQQETRQRSA